MGYALKAETAAAVFHAIKAFSGILGCAGGTGSLIGTVRMPLYILCTVHLLFCGRIPQGQEGI
jgi:hypothetical protein